MVRIRWNVIPNGAMLKKTNRHFNSLLKVTWVREWHAKTMYEEHLKVKNVLPLKNIY